MSATCLKNRRSYGDRKAIGYYCCHGNLWSYGIKRKKGRDIEGEKLKLMSMMVDVEIRKISWWVNEEFQCSEVIP